MANWCCVPVPSESDHSILLNLRLKFDGRFIRQIIKNVFLSPSFSNSHSINVFYATSNTLRSSSKVAKKIKDLKKIFGKSALWDRKVSF